MKLHILNLSRLSYSLFISSAGYINASKMNLKLHLVSTLVLYSCLFTVNGSTERKRKKKENKQQLLFCSVSYFYVSS